jgi:hypothetical protein
MKSDVTHLGIRRLQYFLISGCALGCFSFIEEDCRVGSYPIPSRFLRIQEIGKHLASRINEPARRVDIGSMPFMAEGCHRPLDGRFSHVELIGQHQSICLTIETVRKPPIEETNHLITTHICLAFIVRKAFRDSPCSQLLRRQLTKTHTNIPFFQNNCLKFSEYTLTQESIFVNPLFFIKNTPYIKVMRRAREILEPAPCLVVANPLVSWLRLTRLP